jgi:hypothetical protein
MKHAATMALILNLGVAGLYARERPVKMTFSGTAGPSAVNLQYPDAITSEYNFAGNGALGAFTFRTFSASAPSPQPSSTCSGPTQFYGTVVAGAGVLRVQDGSLLVLTLTEGTDCIDFAAQEAHCIRTFNITGGTGRFKDASGTLTFDEILHSVLADASMAPVFFSVTGEVTGMGSGLHMAEDRHGDQ